MSILTPFNYVTIEISGICNAKCKYCATGSGSANPGTMMSLDLFKKTLDRLIDLGAVGETSTIGLFNKGEPFLNPNFSEILDYIILKNLKFSLSSNFNVYKKMSHEQINSCTGIIVSVGWSQSSYDKVHKFNFKHIKENIIKFKKDFGELNQQNKLFITYHLYKYNISELPLAIAFSKKNGLSFHSYYAHIIDYWKIKKFVEHKLEEEALEDIKSSLFLSHLEDNLSNVPANYKCPQEKSLNIDEYANILTCCVLPNNINGYSQGNLFEKNAVELIKQRQNVSECSTCIKYGISKLEHSFANTPKFVYNLTNSKYFNYTLSKIFFFIIEYINFPMKKKIIEVMIEKIFNKGGEE